jgi:hypothetical protein
MKTATNTKVAGKTENVTGKEHFGYLTRKKTSEDATLEILSTIRKRVGEQCFSRMKIGRFELMS